MIIQLIALSLSFQTPSLHCVVTGEAMPKAHASYDYNGVRYDVCCGGCAGKIQKDPKAVIANAAKNLKVPYGTSLFDPVSGARIEAKKDTLTKVHEGTRYYFATPGNLAKFEADAKKFTVQPEKEALHCAVMNHAIESYDKAGAYVDHAGTRYYVCCTGCLEKMKGDTVNLSAKVAGQVKAPTVKQFVPKPKA